MVEPSHALGLALLKDEDLDGATEAFRTVIKLKPDFARAYNDLGLTLSAKA